MGREVRRVPLDFDHPLNEVWPGFLSPDWFDGKPCTPCEGRGYSPEAKALQDRWYGYVPFTPRETGSEPLTPEVPEVRAFAESNVEQAPDYYGTGEAAIVREARRLCGLWNGAWMHHLSQADVNVLIAAGRLQPFTHVWVKGEGWKAKDPVPTVTAAEVNRWTLTPGAWPDFGPVLEARCAEAGVPVECQFCDGYGSTEMYEGQRAEADAWEPEDPPAGDGWQLWETVSEGSPISPVFASAESLARWLADPDRPKSRPGDEAPRDWMPYDAALKFVHAGWAPTAVSTPATGVVSGAEFVGFHQDSEVGT